MSIEIVVCCIHIRQSPSFPLATAHSPLPSRFIYAYIAPKLHPFCNIQQFGNPIQNAAVSYRYRLRKGFGK